jgi:uncharacterized membrane protein
MSVSTNRLEAFSDGVIAVAITLLVLNITVPQPGKYHGTLAHALLNNWQYYLAYATSFITIGIIWINHHVMISRLRATDHTILLLNLTLLLCIGLLPFSTSLLTTYLRQGNGQQLAAGIYAGSLLLMSIAFATLNAHILLRKTALLNTEASREQRLFILGRSLSGLLPYVIAVGLAAVSPYATVVICAGVAVFYATPLASGVR